MPIPLTRAELTIDLAAIARNWLTLGTIAAGTRVAAMVKADGYGIGATPAVETLHRAGCEEFFVAEIGEAVRLREAGTPAKIFVLAGAQPGTLEELVAHDLVPVLIDLGQIEAWTARAEREGRSLPASVHLDTGMNRTGLDEIQTAQLLAEPDRLDGLDIVHVMSHLASADDGDTDQNERQLASYRHIRAALPGGVASLANTPGIALGPEYHFDHVRPGIGLYGADPSPGRTLGLEPVVQLRAPVIQVRDASAGQTVGYSATHTLEAPRRLATIGVGYGDGFLRSQSARGCVAFGGHRAPILGRISMDLITVDITDLPADVVVHAGTGAELIGSTITLDEVADAAQTIPYEILTALGRRYQRRYVD